MTGSSGADSGTRKPLAGRTALVTGAAGGIGSAVCEALDRLGARIVAADRDLVGASQVAARLGSARTEHVDLGDPSSVESLVTRLHEDHERIELLVHNAGISIVGPFIDSDPAEWEQLWQVNLRGPMLLTRLLLRDIIATEAGRIVFVSSDSARAGGGNEAAYAASKAGLFGLSKSLAREIASRGATSNVVCPGVVDTPMSRGVRNHDPDLFEKLERRIPMRRLGTPEDVAEMIAFLCGPGAGYLTGQIISVSGGITMS